ncbi:MAG: hypothetical protein A2X81_06205 [Desulfobacterales bacterium GWB2_56_26]|nr:MAG: hypothetical protein A2X81_06205 [Desulfobacterales bacterium GWB2_56_26]
MLREQKGILLAMHQVIDLIIVAFSFYLANETRIHFGVGLDYQVFSFSYHLLLLLALISFHFSLRLMGGYGPYRKVTIRQVFQRVFEATLTSIVSIILLFYTMHIEPVSRMLMVLFSCYAFIGLISFRIALYKFLAKIRSKNYNTKSILLVGSHQRALDFIHSVRQRRTAGYLIRGCLEMNDRAELVGKRIYESVWIIGTMDNFKEILRKEAIDEVVFGIPLKAIANVHEYIYYAEEMGKNVRVLPDFQLNKIKYYPRTARVDIEDFLGATTLVLSSVPKNTNELVLKACIDYAGAAVGIILLSPLFMLLSLLIKLTSRGPIIFAQERSGLNGRRFMLYKFRSMVINAEEMRDKLAAANEMDGPVFKLKKDPRITWIGSIMRKTSLDELPQLFNVLKGEMSLVGPRPPLPTEVEKYKLWQRRRLSMKPGLTCIWQVSGRNNISFEQWMNMDLEYIDNWSLGLDIKLLLLTFKEVAVGGGH